MRPELLFIAPLMPAPTGNGLAIRAALLLDALAADHRVTLLVVPVADPKGSERPNPFVRQRTRTVIVQPLAEERLPALLGRVRAPAERARLRRLYPRPALCRFAGAAAVAQAVQRIARPLRWAVAHRLYLAPFALPFAERGAELVLDLDDDEVATHTSLAGLLRQRGELERAEFEDDEAVKYAALEAELLPRFARVAVASPADARAVRRRCGDRHVAVVPNAVAPLPPRADPSGPPTLLFIGNMTYLPNLDGVEFFCERVWPRIRAELGAAVRLEIAGRTAPGLARLRHLPGVTLHDWVANLDPLYVRAHLAIAPLRAGGGTRIKLLEAFARGVPVVATPTGAAGLDLEDGRELLLADSPEGFAEACLRVLRSPRLGRQLARRAHALILRRYTWDRVAASTRHWLLRGGELSRTPPFRRATPPSFGPK